MTTLKTHCVAILCLQSACLAVLAANDWENPDVNSINRLPPRTYSMPLANVQDALIDDLEPATPYKMSLNGRWKYAWTGNPARRPRDFHRINYDDSCWQSIDVPSCVELRGFGSPVYTNQKYPHADLSHPTNVAFASIRDRMSGRADYNPVSSYRRSFVLPETWRGRRVVLRFDGVYSAYYVWLNGIKVGYAEDSKLPSEFDVTPFLNAAADGENVLAVEVYRWCDGSYLEDQDMTRFSGIFRDVTLWAMPQDGIWDFEVRTRLSDDYQSAMLTVLGLEGEWTAALHDSDRLCVGTLSGEMPSLRVEGVNLWSAEKPYLYTLVLTKGNDVRMKRIGFKEQKIVGNLFLVNGRKIKFKGVNRHETSPENGRTVSLEDMVRDITLMKRYNINTVRTSHYPDHHLWYDLCDRYGIYLCAEANVEAHEPGYRENGLGRFREWDHSIVERNERHVKTYRNHPSVTLWSVGNETGHGDCFRHAIAAVKAADPTRPVHWERGNPDADIDSRMYPSVEWLEARGRLGDGLDMGMFSLDDPEDERNRQTSGKPFFLCEYAHAMGNALGNFEEYWEVFNRYDSLSGGCIWDWIDQAVWKPTGHVDKDGTCAHYLSYGGDYDEQPNDGPFNCNGVIGPARKVSAKLIEVGQVYRNLVVTRNDDGSFELWNRHAFTSSDAFDGEWELVSNGRTIRRGTFDTPSLGPLSRCGLDLPDMGAGHPAEERFLNVNFLLKADTLWAKKGWPVSRNQVLLDAATNRMPRITTCAVKISEDERSVTVECGRTRAVFCRSSGTLCELKMGDVCILKDLAAGVPAGPLLTCMRAFVDNDRWLLGDSSESDNPGPFMASGLSQLHYHARPITIADGVVKIVTDVTGAKSAGFTQTTEWSFSADGAVVARNAVDPYGAIPEVLPRLGLSLKLNGALEHVRYYGRGPWENYVDRCSGSFVGIYSTTVTGLFEEYVRPQDNGYRTGVRWVTFCDENGCGVRFSASEPMFVQALHYDVEDLLLARPRRGQPRFRTPLVPRHTIYLNLDFRQLGLGGGSCGPRPMDKYIFPVVPMSWTVIMEPAGKCEN